jgi:hypothetical protein
MDDKQVFETALSQYRDTYIQVGLDQQPPNALDESRTSILNSLARLEDLVNSESAEIRQFPDNAVQQRNTTRALVSGANDLKTQRRIASDELHRIGEVLGTAAPPPDMSPVYTRLGVLGGLLVILVLIRSTRVVV